MNEIHLGVANSISANFEYDPLDTIKFALQENFKTIQIYLNTELLSNQKVLDGILKSESQFSKTIYHAEGDLNLELADSDYIKHLHRFIDASTCKNYILHFDERMDIDKLLPLVQNLLKNDIKLYVENYFHLKGKECAEKNIKKFMALFTLTNTLENQLFPVIDVPRLFHKDLRFSKEESLAWCYQLLNFFSNKDTPIILHLIDCNDPAQLRGNYCPIGEGNIPYEELFDFILKTNSPVSNIVLEFEDKINPLTSRQFLEKYFTFI